MKTIETLRLGGATALLCSLSGLAVAQVTPAQSTPGQTTIALDTILVQAGQDGPMSTATGTLFVPGTLGLPAAADGGAMLASLPGISAVRMGGHGLDVVIRGMQANQINVIDAGAVTYGGCPNRMDPPTATASFARADSVQVERGYASVTNGPGGSGGTVILKRQAPELAALPTFSGGWHLGGATNSNAIAAGGNFTWNIGNGFYLKGAAEAKTAKDYKDGSGRRERTAYTQQSGGLTFGYAGDSADIALDYDQDHGEDILFAGAGMDSPVTDTSVWRLRGGVDLNMGALTRIEGEMFLSEVDHVMDNYSLRPAVGMLMRVPSSSDTWGGKLEAQLSFGTTTAKLGIDKQSNSRRAILYSGPAAARAAVDAANPANARFLMWPDATIAQTGIYLETETALSAATTLKTGLRYDRVRASAASAAGLAGYAATVPNGLYTTYYGNTFNTARTEDNLGGLLRLEHEFQPGTLGFVGLSRSVRTADANERAMARSTWVGNPDINPEKHTQLDFGIEVDRGDWFLNATAFVDRVDDYILRDATTFAGVTTYRNVAAQLSGLEVSGSWQHNDFTLAGDLTWTHGQNRDDNQALAQIPPLQGGLSMAWEKDAWGFGARLNWAAAQNRVDLSRDPGATPGWATIDVFASYAVNDKVALKGGIDNVLDHTYANHLARSNAFDTTVAQVNEPGRTLYLTLESKF